MKKKARKLSWRCLLVSLAALTLIPVAPAEALVASTTYDYDAQNGIITKTDANNEKLKFQFDSANRLSEVDLINPSNQTTATYTYQYTATNQLKHAIYPGGQTDYDYGTAFGISDFFDLPYTISEFGKDIGFEYDHKDRITRIDYPDNMGSVCYVYDADGRILRVGRIQVGVTSTSCSESGVDITSYDYDGKGRLKTINFPNGVQTFVEYYADTGLPKTYGHRYSTGVLIDSDAFAYVPNTNLYRSITHATPGGSKTTTYQYDALQRLKVVSESDGRTTTYSYDEFGNRTEEKIENVNDPNASGGSPKPYGDYIYYYAANSNRLDHIDYKYGGAVQSSTTFQYDNAGRMRSKTAGAVITTYGYDARGLLTSVSASDGTTVTYTYDAMGVRNSKTVNGVTTYYLTASMSGVSHVLMELDSNLKPTVVYAYAGSRQLIEMPYADNSGDLYLLHDGYVGSLTSVVDRSGRIKDQFSYDAFGVRAEDLTTANDSAKHYGYTGEEYEQEAGLLYLRTRYYDPLVGRFISADSFWGNLQVPESQNRYIYVQNNPVSFVDPTGKGIFTAIYGVAVGAYAGYEAGGAYGAWVGGFSGGLTGFILPGLSRTVALSAVELTGSNIAGLAAGTATFAAGGGGAAALAAGTTNILNGDPPDQDLGWALTIGAVAPLGSGEAVVAAGLGDEAIGGGISTFLSAKTGLLGVLGAAVDPNSVHGFQTSVESTCQ